MIDSLVAEGEGRARSWLLPGLAVAGAPILLGLLAILAVLLVAGAISGTGSSIPTESAETVSARARAEIPREYLRLYQRAARRYGLNWAVLAGIGKVECDHGQDPAPSCTQEGVVNEAGAGGPAQFIQSTWERYGVSADGQGPPDRWRPSDAILSMANYLRASGAPGDYRQAIYAYNHADWYVEEVLRWARIYSGDPSAGEAGEAGEASGVEARGGGGGFHPDLALTRESSAPVIFTRGTRARLDPHHGHIAMIPAGAPAVVQAMVAAGNELQDLPYGPDGHPDPLGAPDEDCSSSVNYVLYMAGLRPLAEILRENPLAQSYPDWGEPGPGRWVTIYSTTEPTDHVFIVIAGLRLDTSHNGTDVGPNRAEGGPRWRILAGIPTWAHWSVTHPPGL